MDQIIKSIPSWLIALATTIFIFIFVERTYISQKPFKLFDLEFGPVNTQTEKINSLEKKLTLLSASIDSIEKKLQVLGAGTSTSGTLPKDVNSNKLTLSGVDVGVGYNKKHLSKAIEIRSRLRDLGARVMLEEKEVIESPRIKYNGVEYENSAILIRNTILDLQDFSLKRVKYKDGAKEDIGIRIGG